LGKPYGINCDGVGVIVPSPKKTMKKEVVLKPLVESQIQ
jgi:hypothetical protein